jgi:hypothetical protein
MVLVEEATGTAPAGYFKLLNLRDYILTIGRNISTPRHLMKS